ncbi:MAG TPA: DoxX family protein [Candidatus Krumholzibacteria bacterium]
MFRRIFSSDEISFDFGIFLARLGVGLSVVMFHGWDKITGGPELWTKIGANMELVHITWYPVVWGFMAAFAESVCAALIVVGVLFRPAALLLAFTMFVAVMRHLNLPADNPNHGWSGASHALELMSVCLCFFFSGPGKFSLTPRG